MISVADIHTEVKLEVLTFCSYQLHFYDQKIRLSFPQLLQLRQRLNHYTSPCTLTELINRENFVLLFVADRKHLLFLEIPTLIDLEEKVEALFSLDISNVLI